MSNARSRRVPRSVSVVLAGVAAVIVLAGGASMTDATKSVTTRDLVVTRVFDAPPDQVWKAWSDPQHVMRWWGPTGFTSPSCSMDFRVGGTSLVCMRATEEFGGQDMYNTWTYGRIEPTRRIEFVLRFSDKDGNTLDPGAMGLPPGIPGEVPTSSRSRPRAATGRR